MRVLAALSLATASLIGSAAHAASPYQAKGLIVAAVQKSKVVANKTGAFKTRLGGKPGDSVRPFTASNVRMMIVPFGGPGAAVQGGARIHVGGIASGTINLKTDKVKVNRYVMTR